MGYIDSDFSETELAVPFSAGNHARYAFVSASPTVMEFVAGTSQTIELAPKNGGGWLAYYLPPQNSHNVCAEVRVLKGTSATYGSTAKAGLFVRLSATSDFIRVVVNLNTGRLEIHERVSGTYTLLANPTLQFSPSNLGCTVKVAVIGRYLSYWYNPRMYACDDEPPMGTATLSREPADSDPPLEWGIYMESNVADADFRAVRFTAYELPDKQLPAPSVTFENAANYNFTCITATASSIPSGTLHLEWEVAPIDVDDYPETIRERTIIGMNPRKFWVRDGYVYEVRVRSINAYGAPGKWSTPQRITASGTKVAPTAPTYPDDVFPDVEATYVMEHQQASSLESTESGTDRERFVSMPGSPRARRSWSVRFENKLQDEIIRLRQFYDLMSGQLRPFQYEHPETGEILVVRFASANNTIDVIDEGDPSAVYTAEVSFIEVLVGNVGTLAVTLELDSSLQ